MRRALAAGLALGLALAACGSEDIVIATVAAADAAAPRPVACGTSDDCPGGAFCSKATCAAATGTCELFPPQCDPTLSPVCGCDGITYFDDCWRRAAGAPAATVGACRRESATPCGGPQHAACPAGALCARLLGFGGPCPFDPPGTCWVIPPACPPPSPEPPPDAWDDCAPQGRRCVDTCNAVRSGSTFRRAYQCP